MDTYKSDVVAINHAVDTVYGKLSNPEAFKNVENFATLPDDVKAKIGDITFGEDSISFNVDPIGNVTLQIVERVAPNKIVYSATSLPIPFKAVINLEEAEDGNTKAEAELQVELNMFIRPMVDKPLKEGAKKFGELLAVLPYDKL